MPNDDNRTRKPSTPREVRINRLNRRPGRNKSIIALGVMILLIVLFIMVFLMRRLY